MINLHTHTDHSNYRMLDCTNKIPDLIAYAKKLGHKGIAITDHETVGSHMEANEYQDENFKIILGNEIYLCKNDCKETHKYPHFILLAKDAEGHRALRELSTRAWCENSHYWVNLRVPTHYEDLVEVMSEYKGHVIGMTACAGGALGKMILSGYDPTNWLLKMVAIFGEGNFFMEMQPSVQEEQDVINKKILELSDKLGIDYVITTDAHYLKKEEKEIHKAFLQSQEADRETGLFYETTYLMSEEEIHRWLDGSIGYDNVERAFRTSESIMDMCEVYSLEKPLRIPYNPTKVEELDMELYNFYKERIPNLEAFLNHDVGPKEGDPNRHLVALAIKNMAKEPEIFNTEKAYKEIEFELDSIIKLSEKQHTYWAGYILQTRELINVCWDHSLVGCSRGSGAGFVLLYLCEVIQINMLREEVQLYPWRFLNKERVSPLDIDCDIEGDKKEEIISSMMEKFGGYRHVTKVQTLLKAKTKNSIQIACRGLGESKETAQFLGGFVKYERGTPWTLEETYENDRQFRDLIDTQYKEVYRIAKYIEGVVVGVGQHAGGVIYDNHDLVDSVALMKSNAGDIITQNDLHKSEAASLIKYDLLGVDYLTKVHTCIDLLIEGGLIEDKGSIKDTYEEYLNIYKIDRTSDKVWNAICNQEVLSIFQFEGQAGVQAIKLGQPRSLEDMAALNSVMRLMSDNNEPPLQKYARFKNDISEWYKEMNEWGVSKEDQKWLEGYCLKNYGFLPNQENFMSILQDEKVGGHDLLFADLVRKAVAKKNPKTFLEKEEEYYQAVKDKKLNKELCTYVWEVLIGASKGYGFNTL